MSEKVFVTITTMRIPPNENKECDYCDAKAEFIIKEKFFYGFTTTHYMCKYHAVAFLYHMNMAKGD
jgi:hypothetical protein